MVAFPATAAQARALTSNPSMRSIRSNDQLFYQMNQARMLAVFDRLRVCAPGADTTSGNRICKFEQPTKIRRRCEKRQTDLNQIRLTLFAIYL